VIRLLQWLGIWPIVDTPKPETSVDDVPEPEPEPEPIPPTMRIPPPIRSLGEQELMYETNSLPVINQTDHLDSIIRAPRCGPCWSIFNNGAYSTVLYTQENSTEYFNTYIEMEFFKGAVGYQSPGFEYVTKMESNLVNPMIVPSTIYVDRLLIEIEVEEPTSQMEELARLATECAEGYAKFIKTYLRKTLISYRLPFGSSLSTPLRQAFTLPVRAETGELWRGIIQIAPGKAVKFDSAVNIHNQFSFHLSTRGPIEIPAPIRVRMTLLPVRVHIN